MLTIDLYILRQLFRPLAVALVVALLVLLIERLLNLLNLILGSDGPFRIVFQIMTYLAPQYLGLALPVSLMLGIMIGFNQMSRSGELDAMQSAGISLMRQTRVAVLAAVLVMVPVAVAVAYLKPIGRYAYQAVVYSITNAAFGALLRPGVFTEFGGNTYLVQDVDTETGRFSTVFVYQQNDRGESTTITARDGNLISGGKQGPPLLRLFNGVRLSEKATAPSEDSASQQRSVGALRFQELRTAIPQEKDPMFRQRGVDEREYTLHELWRDRNTPPPGVSRNDMLAEFNERVVRILSVPFLPFLAVILAIGRRRKERMYGIGIGLIILLAYNQILNFGKNLVETGAVPAVIGLWLPLAVFSLGACLLFWAAAARVPSGSGFHLGHAAAEWIAGLFRRSSRRDA
jgi:lipopolysaccharide export system permease protein